MRAAIIGVLSFLLVSCSALDGVSGFGSQVAPTQCVKALAPAWLLDGEAAAFTPAVDSVANALRVVTYNLHSGLGSRPAFRRSRAVVENNLRAIAATIAARTPDVVALNEVDFHSRRSGRFNHAEFIAAELQRITGAAYAVVTGETWQRNVIGLEVKFGNAALVRHPVIATTSCLFDDAGGCGLPAADKNLPAVKVAGLINRFAREARGIVKVSVNFHGQPVDVLITHLDAFVLAEREAQAAHLVRRFVTPGRTTVLLGDLNAVPTAMTGARAFFAADRTHDILTSGSLADARVMYASLHRRDSLAEWATFPADAPRWPLDGVLASLDLSPRAVEVIGTTQSDHRGLFVEYTANADANQVKYQQARHDAIRSRQLAGILACDFNCSKKEQAAKANWLLRGTGFLDIASAIERAKLMSMLAL